MQTSKPATHIADSRGQVHVPTPISSLVLKVASRCNLDCDYCYEYRFGDDSWKRQPALMSTAVAEQIGRRIAEHAMRWQLTSVGISLHGGEPLLAGADRLRNLMQSIRRGAGEGVAITFGMQTNATLINAEVAEALGSMGLSIGVSLDGPAPSNNRHRLDHQGRSSFEATVRGLHVLREYTGRTCFAGILSVIDLDADPIANFNFIASFSPPQIDFLLPHANWDRPPPGQVTEDDTPYADWLIPIFDVWFNGRHNEISLRTFEEIIEHLIGGAGSLETLGLEPVSLLTIASSGEIEGVDTLKSAFPGAHKLGLNVFDHSFDDALPKAGIAARHAGLSALGEQCVTCPIVGVCGGGYYPHRYASANGFRNPSVYCKDLKKLVTHVAAALRASSTRGREARSA